MKLSNRLYFYFLHFTFTIELVCYVNTKNNIHHKNCCILLLTLLQQYLIFSPVLNKYYNFILSALLNPLWEEAEDLQTVYENEVLKNTIILIELVVHILNSMMTMLKSNTNLSAHLLINYNAALPPTQHRLQNPE